MLGDHFSSCFNQAMPPLSPVEHPRNDTELHNTPEDFLCCVEEIYNYLSTLDTSKATGPDGISARMLKETANTIAPSVTALLNLSLHSGSVPSQWKKSLIVPIPKTSSATTPNDYRPISLLSILSKVLERHIISNQLHQVHPISNSQWNGM